MTQNEIIFRFFLDCLTEATKICGEEFQASFSINTLPMPVTPYFTADIFFGYLDPSKNSNQGWIVCVAYRFYWYGLSSTVWRKRQIETFSIPDERDLTGWIVETVNWMKRDSELREKS